MDRRRARCSRLHLFGVGLATLLALPVAPDALAGTVAAGVENAAAPPEQKNIAISPADIPDRADADEQFIRAVVGRSQSAGPKAQHFEEMLGNLSSGVMRLAGQSNDVAWSTLSLETLASLRRHWFFYERAVSRWRVDVQQLTKESLADSTGLATRRAAWQATRLATADSAPAMLRRVDDLIEHIEQAQKALSLSLAKTLDLGQRGNELQSEVHSGEADVLARIADHDRRLLLIDSPPLWQAASRQEAREPIGVVRKNLQIDLAFARDYDAAHVRAMRVEIVCGALLLPLMLWIRHRARQMIAAGKADALSMHPLLHPWAAWLVLVALGTGLLGIHGPILRQKAVISLAWIPVLRLLRPQVRTLIGPRAYLTAAACYLLNVVASLLVGSELWYRSLLLTIDLLALAAILWWSVRVRPSATLIKRPKSSVWLTLLLGITIIVLLASIGSNVLGDVSLATMLTGALMDSSYVALGLYAGATVVVALFRLLLPESTISSPIMRDTGSLAQVGVRVGRTLLVAVWLLFVLQSFRIYRPLVDYLVIVFSYHFKLGVLSIGVGNSAGFLATAWLAFWLSKTVRLVLGQDILPLVSLPRGLGNTISTLTYYAILFFGLLAALAIAGFHLGELTLVFGALSVGIGFGLQDVVKNFVSGLILMFERPIQPGDVVEVAGTSGTVRDIGIRATILTTPDGAEVVVPERHAVGR